MRMIDSRSDMLTHTIAIFFYYTSVRVWKYLIFATLYTPRTESEDVFSDR